MKTINKCCIIKLLEEKSYSHLSIEQSFLPKKVCLVYDLMGPYITYLTMLGTSASINCYCGDIQLKYNSIIPIVFCKYI